MKKNYTHVSFMLDNSGSMRPLRKDTIGGYNSFIAKQKEDPGKMTFSLYQFNKEAHFNHQWPYIMPAQQIPIYDGGIATMANGAFAGAVASAAIPSGAVNITIPTVISDKPGTVTTTYEFVDLKTIPELSMETYECDTNTPLLDTIGHALDKTGELLNAMSESERPEKVIFVILTDGEENASHVYTHAQITAKIKHQTDAYNWDFLFLGANQDAIQTGSSYGIVRGRSMSLSATAQSIGSTYSAVSDTISMMKAANVSKNVNIDDSIRASVLDGTYNGSVVTPKSTT